MNKKYAFLTAIVAFLTFGKVWSADNPVNYKAQVDFIYAADAADRLDTIDAQSSIRLLQDHTQWLQSQKSSYAGVFKNPKIRFLGKAAGTTLSLAAVALFGVDLATTFLVSSFLSGSLDDQSANSFKKGMAYGRSYGDLAENSFNDEDKKFLEEYLKQHKYRAVGFAIPFALSVGFLAYINQSARKAALDELYDKEIQRDQAIVARLQQRVRQ